MWPDRREIDLFGIEHPLILAPMTGVGTVNLAASVCAAGGLGTVSCATLQPERAAQTIKQLREMTDRPINANFFCHVRAKSDIQREQAWRERLSRYHRELGIDTELQRPHFDIAPFGAEMCSIVEAVRPEVVSFHLGLPDPPEADGRTGRRVPSGDSGSWVAVRTRSRRGTRRDQGAGKAWIESPPVVAHISPLPPRTDR